MTLYMLTSGCYSDYRVAGIYSSKQKAEEAAEVFALSDHDIEEVELDAVPAHPPGMLRWQISMDRHGNTSYAEREGAPQAGTWLAAQVAWSPCYRGGIDFHVWGRDREHAIKVANESRIGLLASDQWTEDRAAWLQRFSDRTPAD